MKYGKPILTIIFISLILFFSIAVSSSESILKKEINYITKNNTTDTVHLWNGKNLDGLLLILKIRNAEVETPCKVQDGILYFYGKQIGFFQTKEIFSNYKLHAEWRWPEKNENGNSGVLLHIQQPDTVWPKCFQVQLKKDNAGDLLGMNGASTIETAGKPKDTNAKLNLSNEKPEQEWNACDIICHGELIEVYINDLLQNKGTKSNLTKGTIGFQLEGKPIEFRNIFLIKN
jgi:hypothetical protein